MIYKIIYDLVSAFFEEQQAFFEPQDAFSVVAVSEVASAFEEQDFSVFSFFFLSLSLSPFAKARFLKVATLENVMSRDGHGKLSKMDGFL